MSWMFKETEHSQLYLKYRPDYPDSVFKLFYEKLKQSYESLPEKGREADSGEGKKWKLALDVGCGTGMATLPLAKYFEETFGIDVSETQIFEAKKAYGNRDPSKVTFLCHDSNVLSQLFKESSVDLISVALAIHYFDRVPFYNECNKVLKPGGLLVAYGYGAPYFDDPRVNQIYEEFFDTIKHFAEEGAFHIRDCYGRIFQEFQQNFSSAERDDSLTLVVDSTVQDHAGYLSTWSPYRKYLTMNPSKQDPLKVFYEKFKDIYPNPLVNTKRYAKIFILFGRRA